MKRAKVPVQLFLSEDESQLRAKAAAALKLPIGDILSIAIDRKSVDARKNDVKFLYMLSVTVPDSAPLPQNTAAAPEPAALAVRLGSKKSPDPPVVIGAGPCGLFAVLLLAENGYRPVVLERGGSVEERLSKVRSFFSGGAHNPNTNVLFGDGGAGAFSDGKLTARTREEAATWVLEALVDHGAPEEILYSNKPHLGTDVLTGIICCLKARIIDLGGTWHNGAKVIGFEQNNGKLSGVLFERGGQKTAVACESAILATGHSARDTYEMLFGAGIPLVFKPFAVGLRVEHPQAMIDEIQYGRFAGHPKLGAADYALTAKAGERGVYTFCMCPGGIVIPSVSEAGHLCVNGMSHSTRDGQNANSAIVVQVTRQDCGDGTLSGVQFQRTFEQKAYKLGGGSREGGYEAPVTTIAGFLQKQAQKPGAVKPSYPIGTKPANLWECLPPFAAQGIAKSIGQFDQKLRGFALGDAVLTGVEMRTSSPVRILRNEDRQCDTLPGLYPAGEGAGYAGGIVSAAADGVKAALSIMGAYAPR